jgi:hypothetical protein
MAKAMTEEVLIGKFDILATYTYAKALLDDEPEFRRDHLDERDDPNRIIGGLVSDLAQGVCPVISTENPYGPALVGLFGSFGG